MADTAHRQDARLALEAKRTELQLEREKNKKRKLEFDTERLRIEQEDRRERMRREEERDNRLFGLMSGMMGMGAGMGASVGAGNMMMQAGPSAHFGMQASSSFGSSVLSMSNRSTSEFGLDDDYNFSFGSSKGAE
jgi:hypothetical protein